MITASDEDAWDLTLFTCTTGGRMVAAVVAFAINYACYFSEIYRGGIEAVPKMCIRDR